MALDSDHVVDRRRLKRHLLLWRVAAIVATVALVVALAGGVRELAAGDHVARLTVESLIVDDPWRDAALAEVAEDSSVRALLIRIDSPGGTVVGGEALYHSLRAVAEKKPVIAVMGELATSAGYMIALGANHIVARAGTLTGSIGVIMQSADVTGLLDKLGIKPYSIKSRPLKAQPNPLEPLTEESRQAAKAVVLDFFEFFVDLVAERRDMPREVVLRLADGRVFTGRQALANGLVDQIGGETQARNWLDETHEIAVALPVRDVVVDHGEDFWRDAIGNALGKMLSSERLSLDGLVLFGTLIGGNGPLAENSRPVRGNDIKGGLERGISGHDQVGVDRTLGRGQPASVPARCGAYRHHHIRRNHGGAGAWRSG